MNPSLKKDEHVLALDDSSTVPDLDTVVATAEFYRVSVEEAKSDLARLRKVLGSWEERAKRLGLSAEDRLELEACFLF